MAKTKVLSKQVIFNNVIRHLAKQKRRAIKSNSFGCQYRGAGDSKCAIGIFIRDDQYVQNMEGWPVRNLLVRFSLPQLVGDKTHDHADFLEKMQYAHDHLCGTGHSSEKTKKYLRGVAKEYKLRTDVLEKTEFPKRWLMPFKK